MKVTFETTTCGRCGGSGHYSFHPDYGTKCFKCSGSGKELSKKAKVASGKYEAAMTIPASEIKVGMVLMYDKGLSGNRTRCTVESVGGSDTVSISHPDREYIALGFKGCLAHVFTTTGMRLAISPETYDRAREALKGMAGVTITE